MGSICSFASLQFCSLFGIEVSQSGNLMGKPQQWEGLRYALYTVQADWKSMYMMRKPARAPCKIQAKRNWRTGCNSVFLFQPTHRPVNRALHTRSVWARPLSSSLAGCQTCTLRHGPLGLGWKKSTREIKNWAKTSVAAHSEGNRFHSSSPGKLLRNKPVTLRKIKHNQELLSLIQYVWVSARSYKTCLKPEKMVLYPGKEQWVETGSEWAQMLGFAG